MRSCFFRQRGVAVALRPGVKAANLSGNMQPGGLQTVNEIGERAWIGMNELGE
jgi:hypothetical protein